MGSPAGVGEVRQRFGDEDTQGWGVTAIPKLEFSVYSYANLCRTTCETCDTMVSCSTYSLLIPHAIAEVGSS